MLGETTKAVRAAGTASQLVAAVLLAAMVLAVGTGCGGDPDQPTDTGGTTRQTAGPVSSEQPAPHGTAAAGVLPQTVIEAPGSDDHDDHGDQPPVPPVGQAPRVAAAFATAWVRADLTAEQWLAQITPFCEPGFAARLATVDPTNLPARRITGPPVAVSPLAGGFAVYSIPTDGGTLSVTVAAVGGKWLVSANDFTRTR